MSAEERTVTVTLCGNATVRIAAEAGQPPSLAVIADPWLGERIGPWKRLRPCTLAPPDLASATALLISHSHPDHLDRRALSRVPPEVPLLSPNGLPHRILVGLAPAAVALSPWESWEGDGVRVTAVPSRHTRWCLAFVVEMGRRRVFIGGDCGPGTPFAEIRRRCGPLAAAVLPVGGSRLALGPFQRHLTPSLAARAAVDLQPALALPMHWGHVPCVPALLDRFRGTAREFAAEMSRLAPQIPVICPDDGIELPIPEPSCREA